MDRDGDYSTRRKPCSRHEWSYGFKVRKPLERSRNGRDDFAGLSGPYSESEGEPVWMYSWGNSRWLRSVSRCCGGRK